MERECKKCSQKVVVRGGRHLDAKTVETISRHSRHLAS